jgi:hypothetical protein
MPLPQARSVALADDHPRGATPEANRQQLPVSEYLKVMAAPPPVSRARQPAGLAAGKQLRVTSSSLPTTTAQAESRAQS